MPKYQIVIDDEDKAVHGEKARGYKHAEKRPKGTVHAEADSECPDGRPNCRNCGDPAHEASCSASGHCTECGRSTGVPGLLKPVHSGGHGLAPDAYLAAHGYALVEAAKD